LKDICPNDQADCPICEPFEGEECGIYFIDTDWLILSVKGQSAQGD
jgi:hypothetical protein